MGHLVLFVKVLCPPTGWGHCGIICPMPVYRRDFKTGSETVAPTETVAPSAELPRWLRSAGSPDPYPYIPDFMKAELNTLTNYLKPTPSVKETLAQLVEGLKAKIALRDQLNDEIQEAMTTLQGLQRTFGITPDVPMPFGPKAFKGLTAFDAIKA